MEQSNIYQSPASMVNDRTKYKKCYADSDTYTSPKHKRALFPSLKFFTKLIGIIIRSGTMAKQGRYKSVEWSDSSVDILEALESSGISLEVTGLKNIEKAEGSVLFLSNHMSTLETVVLPSMIQPVKEVTFVVKQELLKYPFFGDVLGSRDPIVVGRSNAREDLMLVMNKGSEYLKSGRSVIIFPQKTRTSTFDPSSFNSLGVKLAKKTGASVIPIALVTDAWGNGRVIKDFGKIDPAKKVYIAFGEPMKIQSANGAAEHQMVIDFITNKLIEWGRSDCLTDNQ